MTTTKEKKEYAVLIVLLLAIGWVAYNYFLKPTPTVQIQPNGLPVGISVTVSQSSKSSTGSSPSPVASSAPAASPSITATLLPYGTTIDLGVLKDPRFRELIPPVYPRVTSDMVGQPNPFGK